ncbi:MAG TPA: DUF2244 domain-containing protein [Steroidobacteraceae bacterium]|nr:DUF2244 domain-containing protein [Steroidobacteraceae bacterium]
MDVASLSIEIRPNCSLTVRSARVFFASACVVPFGMGSFLALKGFWPILPFAGLEMLLLAWALKVSLARRFHSQTIIVTESDVCIESRSRGASERVVFPRHWAQVKLRRPAASLHPSRLTIESHGRQCELGSFLTEEERRGLALRLTRLVGRVNESPAWP